MWFTVEPVTLNDQYFPLCLYSVISDAWWVYDEATIYFYQSIERTHERWTHSLIADIEMANRHGHTSLMIACFKGHIRIARFLLSLNADVNRKSAKGNTALHDCAESGSLEIVKVLVQHDARMYVDSYGMTPLLAAAVTG